MKYGEDVIQAFIMYTNNNDIAKAIGKTIRTVQIYKKDPELMRMVEERRIQYIKTSVSKMQSAMCNAVDVLTDIINDKEAPKQTRVNAIQVLFNQCRDWTQAVDILERLERLEKDSQMDDIEDLY